jgi:hypothetical protein
MDPMAAAKKISKVQAMKAYAKDKAKKGLNNFKAAAPWMYGILYSVSIALLTFLIFMPVISFLIVGIICFVLLKSRMRFIKSL